MDKEQPTTTEPRDPVTYKEARESAPGQMGEDRRRAAPQDIRAWISRSFAYVEDIVYVGLGLLLAGSAVVLLIAGAVNFWRSLSGGTLQQNIVDLLDRILLILMIVEILYTVQVSFREHTLVPEPFLIIGLIAATRRILVLTAEFARLIEKPEAAFRNAMLELALLTLLVLALVASLYILGKQRHRSSDGGS